MKNVREITWRFLEADEQKEMDLALEMIKKKYGLCILVDPKITSKDLMELHPQIAIFMFEKERKDWFPYRLQKENGRIFAFFLDRTGKRIFKVVAKKEMISEDFFLSLLWWDGQGEWKPWNLN